MNFKLITGLIMVVTFLVWVFWDLYALYFGGVETTFSRMVTSFAFKSPPLPLLVGMLMGHWFLPPKIDEIV